MQQTAKNTFSTLLLICGSALVLLGIIVFTAASWSAFPPMARIVMVIIPPVLLYVIGLFPQTKKLHPLARPILMLAGSLAFPLSVGTLIYQSGLYTVIDSSLVFLTTLITLFWYLWLVLGHREKWHNLLLIVTTVILANTFIQVVQLPSYIASISWIIVAYFFLTLGWYFERNQEESEAIPLNLAGLAIGLLGLITLPANYYNTISSIPAVLSYVVVAIVLFIVAIFYSNEWQNHKRTSALVIRRVTELSACLCLTVPLLFIGPDVQSNTPLVLLGLLIALTALFLSLVIRIGTLRVMAILAIIFTILPILSLALSQVSVFWPIFLLAAGFILIGLAFLSHHPQAPHWFSRFSRLPESSLWGLGVMPEPAQHKEELLDSLTGKPSNYTPFNLVMGFIITAVIIYLIFIMIGLT